ncbi:MAG: flagellar hook-associated protein FlgK [Planctomycetes bacterium]|nr:flagellar hook-associated protein FlgK [Planctomycetota bacterium]
MSSISSLNVGLKALLAAQSGLDTAGHNVANVGTPGYSRQEVILSSSGSQILNGIAVGSGVEAGAVRRLADQFIGRRLATSSGMMAFLDARLSGLSQLESLYGEPGSDGLSTKLQNLFASFSRLAADPSEQSVRQSVVSAGTDLARRFNSLSGSLDELAHDTRTEIRGMVERVNTLANRIATLNRSIPEFEAGGVPANDMRDQRDQALRELGGFVDVKAYENPNGAMTVQVGGQLLVGPVNAYALRAETGPDRSVVLQIAGHAGPLTPRSGALAGLISVANDASGQRKNEVDALARQVAFQLNRAHSTGVPSGGPFSSMMGAYAFVDQDGDNLVTDETLSHTGLTFPITSGNLRVSVTNKTTGEVETTNIAIDPDSMTVGEFVAQLDAIGHFSASLTSDGRLDLTADPGYGFDFAQRTASAPDSYGTFGGQAASLGSRKGPYTFTAGSTLQVTTATGNATITFQSSDFANINRASADEVAAAMNAGGQLSAIGARAVVVDGRVVVQSLTQGTSATIQATSGTALTTLGWTAGQTATGQTNPATPQISGTYSGTTNQTYTFVPSGDGTIGTTAGLGVDVFDQNGNKITTLAVGQDYVPGTPIAFANGLSVSFQLGTLSKSNGDVASVAAIADADTSDVLAALGVNALVTGTNAATFAIRADIRADPSRLSTSGTGASGDNGALLALAGVDELAIDAYGGQSVSTHYNALIVSVASDASSTQGMYDTEQVVMNGLESRRQSISGVNVDEELIDFERFQQAYAAAARFLSVVSNLQDELMRLV